MKNSVMFNDVTVTRGGRRWRGYVNCSRRSRRSCLDKLTMDCTRAQRVVSKVLRLSVGLVHHLMLRIPTLKVIYIFRDPRPIVMSRFANWPKTFENKSAVALSLCQRISSDLLASHTLKKMYPNRFTILPYEHLAERPIEATKAIFKTFDMDFTSFDTKLVHYLTEGEDDLVTTWNGLRKNSSETASEWRERIVPNDREQINKACHSAFDLMAAHISYPIS